MHNFFYANTEYSTLPLKEIFIKLVISWFILIRLWKRLLKKKISKKKNIPCWQDCQSVLPLLGRFHSTCPRFVWRLVVYLAWHSNTGQSTADNTIKDLYLNCVMMQILWQLISSLFCFLIKGLWKYVKIYMQGILTFFIPDLAAYSSGR